MLPINNLPWQSPVGTSPLASATVCQGIGCGVYEKAEMSVKHAGSSAAMYGTENVGLARVRDASVLSGETDACRLACTKLILVAVSS